MDPIGWLGLGLLVWSSVWGGFGAYVANQKGRSEGEGMVFGALLGPVGLLIVAILPPGKPAGSVELKVVRPSEYVHRPRKIID